MVYLWKVSKLMKFILQFYVFLIFFPKKSKNEKITFRDLFFSSNLKLPLKQHIQNDFRVSFIELKIKLLSDNCYINQAMIQGHQGRCYLVILAWPDRSICTKQQLPYDNRYYVTFYLSFKLIQNKICLAFILI